VVDGNLAVRPADRPARVAGPAFALLDPHARVVAVRRTSRVLIALGGGTHVRRLGADLAAAIVARRPGTRVDLARGFTAAERLPVLPAHCRWVDAPHGLSRHLAAAGVAVVAGGVTLHEACALGSPIVAVPVVPAQRRAIAAAALAGAALTPAGRDRGRVADEAARLVARLLDEPHTAAVMARRASRLVDGLGASRVAARVRLLLTPARREGWRYAA
jgi:spore coat polysaccharide biosynthesis predicted glycosyltransferase SpsG